MPPKYRYFTPEEVKGLHTDLCAMLDMARGFARVPFKILSGLRTEEQNKKAGGMPNSTHLQGLAADIFADNATRYIVVKALLDVGFRRIEVSKDNHVHVDIGLAPEYPQEWFGIE